MRCISHKPNHPWQTKKLIDRIEKSSFISSNGTLFTLELMFSLTNTHTLLDTHPQFTSSSQPAFKTVIHPKMKMQSPLLYHCEPSKVCVCVCACMRAWESERETHVRLCQRSGAKLGDVWGERRVPVPHCLISDVSLSLWVEGNRFDVVFMVSGSSITAREALVQHYSSGPVFTKHFILSRRFLLNSSKSF